MDHLIQQILKQAPITDQELRKFIRDNLTLAYKIVDNSLSLLSETDAGSTKDQIELAEKASVFIIRLKGSIAE